MLYHYGTNAKKSFRGATWAHMQCISTDQGTWFAVMPLSSNCSISLSFKAPLKKILTLENVKEASG